MEIYPNGFKREHSLNLRDLFGISPNGVDYHNPNNIAIEFKETFAKDYKNLWFKIPENQIKNTDFFVFCVHTSKYYVVDKPIIRDSYSFKTYGNRANIRLGKIKSLSIADFDNIILLKKYLDNLKRRD